MNNDLQIINAWPLRIQHVSVSAQCILTEGKIDAGESGFQRTWYLPFYTINILKFILNT